jgi:hypothetical protein
MWRQGTAPQLPKALGPASISSLPSSISSLPTVPRGARSTADGSPGPAGASEPRTEYGPRFAAQARSSSASTRSAVFVASSPKVTNRTSAIEGMAARHSRTVPIATRVASSRG